jgi:hypothetical protein
MENLSISLAVKGYWHALTCVRATRSNSIELKPSEYGYASGNFNANNLAVAWMSSTE